jgi:hypothetical protein
MPTTPDVPTDEALRNADRIILIDPHRPGWCQPLHANFVLSHQKTVEIPVDSSDQQVLQEWRDRIQSLHLDD